MAKCKPYSEIKDALDANKNITPIVFPINNSEFNNPNSAISAYPNFISNKLDTNLNRYEQKIKRQIEAARPYDFINQYTDIRLKIFKNHTAIPEYLINLFSNSNNNTYGTVKQEGDSFENHYIVTGARLDNDEIEVLFALPQNIERKDFQGNIIYPKDYFIQSTKLYKFIEQNYLANTGKNTSELTDISLNKNFLLKLTEGVQPNAPLLIKQKDNKFSLGSLMARYGKHYSKLFSNPYIVTGNNSKFIDPKLVGRTIIIYSKFPTGENVNDQLIREGIVDNNRFGYIPLNENASFSTYKEMMDVLESIGTNNISYNQRRLVLNNAAIDTIVSLYNSTYNDEMKDVLVKVGSKKNQIDYELFMNKLTQAKYNKDFINKLNNILKIFPNGVYISPALVSSNELFDSVLAKVDESNDIASGILYDNLNISGLGDEIVSIGAFPLDIQEENYQQLFENDNSIVNKVVTNNKVIKIENRLLDLTQDIDNSLHQIDNLKEVNIDVDKLIENFRLYKGQDLGINSIDLENLVASLNDIIMSKGSLELTQTIEEYLQEKNPCL